MISTLDHPVDVTTSVELLEFPPLSHRTAALFKSLERTAGAGRVTVARGERFTGLSKWLVVWGPGAPNRFAPMRAQLAAGGHVIAFDLAYWDRERKVRVSIDGPHPQGWVMRREWPTDRWRADHLALERSWKAAGPVVIAGLGEKARRQYDGTVIDQWEADMVATCRDAGYRVVYRAKPNARNASAIPAGAMCANPGSIEAVIRGAAAVVTWHSNVAIDAIRLGIPVVCRDGAAAAVCPPDWPTAGAPQPLDLALRDRFLANLAWFQWAPSEAVQLWAFLRKVLA